MSIRAYQSTSWFKYLHKMKVVLTDFILCRDVQEEQEEPPLQIVSYFILLERLDRTQITMTTAADD